MNRLRSLLLIPAFVLPFAGAVAAQDDTRSFRGSDPDGSTDRGIEAPPPEVKPIPPLQVNPDEVTRGLPFGDTEARVKGFGSATKRSDGTVVRSAPSPELERAIRGRAGGATPNSAADAGPVDDDPAFPQDRAIVGKDNRLRVQENTSHPFRTVGLLVMEKGNSGGSCSATLIGPRTIITAAHCVYDHDEGGWVDAITFYPGANGKDNFPYKGYRYDTATIPQGYIDNYRGFYGSVVPWDIAVVNLKEAAGDRLGWLGYRKNNRVGYLAYNVGYPGDKPYGTMWRDKCDVKAADMLPSEYSHRCDTWPGSSGSSMYSYQKDPESRYVEGINVAEVKFEDRSLSFNIGVPINAEYFDFVKANRK